ncbi:hypothetical protein ABK040_009783 [Willaertia magna]
MAETITPPTPLSMDVTPSDGDETGIKVCVRIRPMNDRELRVGAKACLSVNKPTSQVIMKRKDKEDKSFYFDAVFDNNSSQQEVFEGTGQKIVERFTFGFNACIFAYGQTGSGKTWTMEGKKGDTLQEGIMTRFTRELFAYVKREQDKTEITMKASYLEIYNEGILDLLNSRSNKHDYDIREDKVKGIYVTNLIERPIDSESDLNDILDEGTSRRTVGETKMNAVSSRSHGVLVLSMEQKDKTDEEGFSMRSNKIHLIDLAGSERASATEAVGDRLKEGAKINLSLSSLGNVINALVKKANFVPYRNSKLTRLLKDSIGGNSYTLLISCISPADVNAEESLSTLYFADRCKQIRNKLKVSRGDPKLEKIAELLEIEKQLRARIAELEKELSKYAKVPPPSNPLVDVKSSTEEIEEYVKKASVYLNTALSPRQIRPAVTVHVQTDESGDTKGCCCLIQ